MSFVQWKEGKKEGRKVKVEVVEVVEVVKVAEVVEVVEVVKVFFCTTLFQLYRIWVPGWVPNPVD